MLAAAYGLRRLLTGPVRQEPAAAGPVAVATPVTMALAVWWAPGEAAGLPHPTLTQTAATHGALNALGVALTGLTAWRLLPARRLRPLRDPADRLCERRHMSKTTPARGRDPRTVTIVDIGLNPAFDSSTAVIQSCLRSLDLGGEEDTVAVDVVRTRDVETILSALTAPSDVLHVIAHGTDEPAFVSDDQRTEVSLATLEDYVDRVERAVTAPAVLLDGCGSSTQTWRTRFARCLGRDVAYIGARDVDWHDALVFVPAFYASLFRNHARRAPAKRAVDAAGRAAQAFTLLTDRPSPYRGVLLQAVPR